MSEEWIVESVVCITDESRLIEAAQEITDEVTDLTGALAVLTAPDRTSCGYEVTYRQVHTKERAALLSKVEVLVEYARLARLVHMLPGAEYRDGFAR